MEAFPEPATLTVLPEDIHIQLWARITARLERGDSLIRTVDFMAALSSEYETITGEPLASTLCELFQDALGSYNEEHPERYVAQGVQNSVIRAFQSGCFKLDWDGLQIQKAGARSIARFKSQDWVRGFLKDVHVPPNAIQAHECVRSAVEGRLWHG